MFHVQHEGDIMTDHQEAWAQEAEAADDEARANDRRRRLAAVATAISSPLESASIVELTAVSREAREQVEDHRRMVDLMTTAGHRQRAVACIVDKMTYLELLEFAEDLFGGQSTLDAASFPSLLARWARRAKQP